MTVNEMLELPVYLQVSLGSGFLAYALAYHGWRKDEKAKDLLFGVIAFSLPGLVLWLWLHSVNYALYQSAFLVCVLNVGLGIAWRKWGKRGFYRVMNLTRVSNDEGERNTWERLINDTRITPTQLFVTLKNGKRLCCQDIPAFRDSVLPGGWSIDNDGNIAMFACEVDDKDYSEYIRLGEWGDLVSYIPATEIHSVDFRFAKV